METEAMYLSYPSADKAPAIIVVHEIWGLNDQIKSVADLFAAQGFLALAPDLLAGEIDKIPDPKIMSMTDPVAKSEAQKKMREVMTPLNMPEFAERTVKKLKECFEFLRGHPKSNGTVGIVGFCFGGTYAFALAGAEPELKFAISFYGSPPNEDVIQKITCPVLAFYGDKDERLMQTLPELKVAMEKYHKNFKAVVYPGVGHAFFNEKNPVMYNAEAAHKAWEEVKRFLA